MNEVAIREAWEKFERGDRPTSLRDAVVSSWERSKDFSISTESERAPLISEAQAYRHRSDNLWLARCAAPVLEKCGRFLFDSSTMMILTDPTGVVIETKGDDRSIDAGRAIHLECGGRWTESDIGTNAIGTALASAMPVQIHGREHYCKNVQVWTCAASPIFHPMDGALLGVIDLSGHADTFSKHSLAFAVAAADQIQTVMARNIRIEHWKLIRFYCDKRRRWANDEAIVIDRRGGVVGATSNAVACAQKLNTSVIEQNGISELRNAPVSRWRDIIENHLPDTRVEVVHVDGTDLGAIIVFKQPRGLKKPMPRGKAAENDIDVDSFMEELLSAELGGKPFCLERGTFGLKSTLARDASDGAPSQWTKRPGVTDVVETFVADDTNVQATLVQVSRAARKRMPILISSETGTGKELLARYAHAESGRTGNFVPVNCAAIPANLIEAELFGYVDGAFTGARPGGAKGLAEQADGGTLFLDEIGDMPIVLQAVLLRLLDDWTVRPLGGHPRQIDVQLVSATNADLTVAVKDGRLRRDLFFRLNTLQVTLPPLSHREDFAALATHLLHAIDPEKRLAQGAIDTLSQHEWQGNIRELKGVLARLAFNCSGDEIDAALIEAFYGASTPPLKRLAVDGNDLQDLKRAHVIATYNQCDGNVAQTARTLGVSRNTVYRFLNESKYSN